MTEKERLSQPDFTEVKWPYRKGTGTWTRTLPKHCPWCRDVFFGFQPTEMPWQPYQTDPEKPVVNGAPTGRRSTCGNHLCEEAEEGLYWSKCECYQRSIASRESELAEWKAKRPEKKGINRMT